MADANGSFCFSVLLCYVFLAFSKASEGCDVTMRTMIAGVVLCSSRADSTLVGLACSAIVRFALHYRTADASGTRVGLGRSSHIGIFTLFANFVTDIPSLV